MALRPKLSISPAVSRVDSTGEPVYRVKIRNDRRWRAAIDVEVKAYLWLPGFYPNQTTTKIVDVGTSVSEPLVLPPQDSRVIRMRIAEAVATVGGDGRHEGTSSLETLLSGSGRPGQLRIWLTCTDGYSGQRRAFHARYSRGDISPRRFQAEGIGLAGM